MMTYGLKLIVVGLVKKLVLADHIAPYIDGVFSSMHAASGVQLLMPAFSIPSNFMPISPATRIWRLE